MRKIIEGNRILLLLRPFYRVKIRATTRARIYASIGRDPIRILFSEEIGVNGRN